MQELLLVTNRRSRLRVTALGGAAVGALLGALFVCGAGYGVYTRAQAAESTRSAGLAVAYEAKVLALSTQLKQMEAKKVCKPLEYLAQSQEVHAQRIRDLTAQFPAFKTEPFKTVHSELLAESTRQLQSAQSLRSALAATTGGSVLCAIAPDGEAPASVWTEGVVSLHKDGWRGLPQ